MKNSYLLLVLVILALICFTGSDARSVRKSRAQNSSMKRAFTQSSSQNDNVGKPNIPNLVNAETCYQAPKNPEDRRKDRSKLSIATYNVDWLFLGGSNPNCPGDGCSWANQSQALDHLEQIAQELRKVNADIVNLVEVEGCQVLQVLVEQYGLERDLGYRYYLLPGTDTATHQNVAVLTRIDPVEDLKRTSSTFAYPVSGTKCGAGTSVKGNKSVSKHYYTKFRFSVPTASPDVTNNENGTSVAAQAEEIHELWMMGMHFLAYPTDPARCTEREAQAMVMQRLAASLFQNSTSQSNSTGVKETHLVMLGDLNDYSATSPDVADNQPTSRVLEFLQQSNPTPQKQMYNVAAYLPQTQRYTDWWNYYGTCVQIGKKDLSGIDHLLVSSELQSRLTNVLYRNQDYTTGCDTMISDHWPVVAYFSF